MANDNKISWRSRGVQMARERGWSGRFFTLNCWQMLGLVVYALLFPLSQKLGGRFADIGLFVTFPFIPVGYVIGGLFAQLLATSKAFLPGMVAGIFFQAWLLLIHVLGGKRCEKAEDPPLIDRR
ncbi:hypothetical protein [Dentiradicibacter hellwigii]|uniref:Uncharacterized protein n=1 Tax=Dentiradicibacter hellwigii TaxID=3149053 RepID=A0ABV4UDU6_9RHOO